MMKNADSPFLEDWLATSFRWLVLFGLTISLSIGGNLTRENNRPDLPVIGLLCLPALWNGFMSVLAIYNRRLFGHKYMNVVLDSVFGAVLFIVTGGLHGDIVWVAILPIFSGSVYFGVRGAVPVAIYMTLLQTIYSILSIGDHFQPITSSMITGVNVTASALFSLITAPLAHHLRHTYLMAVNRRQIKQDSVQNQELERMKSLFRMNEILSSTLNSQTVVDTLLSTSVSALSIDSRTAMQMTGVVLLFGNRNELAVFASFGLLSCDQTVQLPARQGAIQHVLKSGLKYHFKTPSDDPELCKLISLHDKDSALCIPLISSLNTYGVILFAHPSPDFFNPERIEILQMLANQAIISIQNARLYQDLAREKERILRSQEEMQKKLARNLHDGPTQSISAIAMRLSIARKLMTSSPKEALEELHKIEDLARLTTQEIRHMLFMLRPLVLESEGLVPALETMAEKMYEMYQQKVTIEASNDVVLQMDLTQQTTVFYLAEEAVNNAHKHANASEICVSIKMALENPARAILSITDNGVGFDVSSVMNSYDRRGSLGMITLRERAELINGTLQIDSIHGQGTSVQISFPLVGEPADQIIKLSSNSLMTVK